MSTGTATLDELIQNRLTLLKNRLLRMRYVKAGDIILADDHNVFVDYARENTELAEFMYQKIKEVEQKAAGGPPWPNPSGLSPFDFLRDIAAKQTEIASGIELIRDRLYGGTSSYMIFDEYTTPLIWRRGTRTFARVHVYLRAPSSTYVTPEIFPYICMLSTSDCELIKTYFNPRQQAYVAGLWLYVAAVRFNKLPTANVMPFLLAAGATYLVDQNRQLYTSPGPTPTGVTLPEWFIIVIFYSVGSGRTWLYLLDTALNLLYKEILTSSSLSMILFAGYAYGSRGTYVFNVDDLVLIETDWEIIVGYEYYYI